MATLPVFNLKGLNLQLNPLNIQPNEPIRAVNVDSYEFGAKKKRAGYVTYLGTPDGAQVNTLFDWQRNNGTQFWNYRASGSALWYSQQGTGAWTICGNGTITNGSNVCQAVLEDTLIVGDGAGSTRHTTNGTSFTNTTAAPIAVSLAEYHNRIYAAGTALSLFWSTTGTATDWTTDSSSVNIPGAGKLLSNFKANDRMVATKNSGLMFRWDEYNLVDISTNLGPTSFQSIGSIEDYRFYLNRLGMYGYGGVRPEIISNKVQKQIYNDAGEGIAGTVFDNAPGVTHRYDYLLAVGTITDDLTDETISNGIIKYNYQLDEFLNYNFATLPKAWYSYKDASGSQQLIFGDASGQCYTFGGTATTDNGSTIEAILEFVVHFGTLNEKKWNWFRASFNPGCQAKVAIAVTNTFVRGAKKWQDLGDASSGVVEYRFPAGAQGVFLFIKIYEASRNARFTLYGYEIEGDILPR